jgi:hypothetical protein
MSRRNENHTVRRIVLPSGRSIEVLRFDETDVPVRQLHICPSCECELVQPHDWAEGGDSRWQLTLECPNCGWFETGLYDRMEIELLEENLDDGVAEMIADLQRLTRANMLADIELFIGALRVDLILPEDF